MTMPQIMQQSAMIGQKYAMKNQAELQQKIQEIIAKHTPNPEPAEEPAPEAE